MRKGSTFEYMLIPRYGGQIKIVRGLAAAAEALNTSKQVISASYRDGTPIKGYYIDQVIKIKDYV